MNHFKLGKLPVAVCLAAIVIVGGCHKKVAVSPPPPPPPAAPAPPASANIRITPSAITAGQSASLSWTTANAASASISGIGTVATSGSQSVYPTSSTTYSLTAQGAGGNAEASARITVNPAAPAAAAVLSPSDEQLFEQNVHDVYFDYDKSDLRPQDRSVVESDAAFLVKHPGMKFVVAGHCDERGSAEYNIALGESRAESMQKALVADGVSAGNIHVISYGKERPFCTESDEQCWQQNRRDHVDLNR